MQLSKNIVQLHCLWGCKMTFSGLPYEHHGLYFIPTLFSHHRWSYLDVLSYRTSECTKIDREFVLFIVLSFDQNVKSPSLITIYQICFVGVQFSRKYFCCIRKSAAENQRRERNIFKEQSRSGNVLRYTEMLRLEQE